jgi:hypothetical protein
MDSDVIMDARRIFNVATWPGSIRGWMERDIDQFPGPGTAMYAINQMEPEWLLKEKDQLTREQGQELLAASKAALEALRKQPLMLKHFIEPYRQLLHDEHEMISRRHLRALEPLVLSGQIDISHTGMAFAGLAYLFDTYGLEGVAEMVGIDLRELL